MHLRHINKSGRGVIGGLILLLILVACGKQEPQNDTSKSDAATSKMIKDDPSTDTGDSLEEIVDKTKHVFPEPPESLDPAEIEKWINSLPPTAAGPTSSLEYYHVVVSGSKHLLLPGNKGLLNVWIGDEEFQPAPDETMNRAETNIVAAGAYALVEADAPDFEVTPATSKCLSLHPSGVDVKFYLSAKSVGDFIVSATVNLYKTQDCSGPAIPKTADTLSVNVVVNEAFNNAQLWQSFVDIFWVKATEFWAVLLAVLFGLILFLVRKQLKKLFGYDQSDS